jgi:hypothetical protein
MLARIEKMGVKRGLLLRLILAGIVLAPLHSILIGLGARLVPFSVSTVAWLGIALFTVPLLVGLLARYESSEFGLEIGKYAFWALFPFQIFYNLSRVVVNLILGEPYWDIWFVYGGSSMGIENNQTWGALAGGALLHSLQGWALAMGFYLLFKPRLVWCLLYGFLFLSTTYSIFFPNFVITAFQPDFLWYFMVWEAHFFFALGLWAVPKVLESPQLRARFRLGNPLVWAVIIVLWIAPFALLVYQVAYAQFPAQDRGDLEAFDRLGVDLAGEPRLTSIEQAPGEAGSSGVDQARYAMSVTVGPRTYDNVRGYPASLEVGPLAVRGHLAHDGDVIASCSAFETDLGSTRNLRPYSVVAEKVRSLDPTEVELDCYGPTEAASELIEAQRSGGSTDLFAAWTADAHLKGARLEEERTFESSEESVPLRIEI